MELRSAGGAPCDHFLRCFSSSQGSPRSITKTYCHYLSFLFVRFSFHLSPIKKSFVITL